VNLTTQQWVGHNFVFLALPAEGQADGYGFFKADQAVQGFSGDHSVRIPYLPNVGKIVKVTDVSPYTASNESFDYVVSMTEIGTGDKFVGRTLKGSIEGLALVEDIVNARHQFLGKTIYPKSSRLDGEDTLAGGLDTTTVTIPIGSPVTVTDVYAGITAKEPIWLIVSANGQKAIIRIAYSWTNQMTTFWTQKPPYQAELFMDDPRISLGCSATVWSQIQSGAVQVGMTKNEVRLSWGPPNNIAQGDGGSMWVYGTKTLTFNGTTLTHIADKGPKN
jgi:hypothetical protein